MPKSDWEGGMSYYGNVCFKKDGLFLRDMSIFLLYFFLGGIIDMDMVYIWNLERIPTLQNSS